MEKIYGYKEKDVIGLAEFLKKKGTLNLSETFVEYGRENGKAKGTVRNLYYALAKRSNFDKEFCQKYFNGTPLKVSKIVEFDGTEERTLIKNVLIRKSKGESVRSAIMSLSEGDAKRALRYQNKYRNAIKNKPNLIQEILAELKSDGCYVSLDKRDVNEKNIVSDAQFKKLKEEINGLVGRINESVRKENEYLKNRVGGLERENLKLCNLLFGTERPDSTFEYFKEKSKRKMLN